MDLYINVVYVRESWNGKVEHATDIVNLELYKKDDELLLEVNFSYNVKTKLTVVTFSSKQTSAQGTFDFDTMEKVFYAIKSSIPNFSWGISSNF